MPQIQDSNGQVWIVCERLVDRPIHRDDMVEPPRDDSSYATLTFITPDGRAQRILSDVAPAHWRTCGEEYLAEWLVLAQPLAR